jgi:iron(III) transport system substrate-binding protein
MISIIQAKSSRRATRSTTFLCGLWIWALVDMIVANPVRAASVTEVLKKIQGLAAAQRRASLEEGAKSEGQVVFYTSVSLTDYPKILAAFEQSYPYIKTNAYRSTPSGVVRRADTEAKAGRYAVDVVGSAPVETWQLRQLQLAAAYLSPERNALFKGAFDPEGYWTAFDVTPIVLAFNTKLVSQQEAPKNYQVS